LVFAAAAIAHFECPSGTSLAATADMRTSNSRAKVSVVLCSALSAGCAVERVDPPVSEHAASEHAAGEHAFAVTAGDVNGDGTPDLVATIDLGAPGDAISVWIGSGDGRFEAPTHTALTDSSRSEAVLLADLDRDGRTDAVTANTALFTVQAFLGDGMSSFAARSTRATAEEPQRLAVGDVNGDGILDAAVAHRDDGGTYLSLLFGRGDGDFSSAATYSGEAGTVAFGVAIGDVDGDQRLDVVTVGLAGGAKIRVHLNRGDGRLEPLDFVGGGLYDVALADVDRDGRLDIVAIERDRLHVLIGRGDGRFDAVEEHAIGAKANALLVEDVDRDGMVEFAVARDDGYVTVFWGPSSTPQRRRQDLATGPNPVSLSAADFDGDGRLELVTANRGSPGSLTVLTLLPD
jgi:hypothetical protein